MSRRSSKKSRIGLWTAVLMAFAVSSALAADVQGSFTGKVICQNGKKAAEFKNTDTLSVTRSSLQDIKRRIDALTWPKPDETMDFMDREKEKTELQHALKLMRDFSCDDNPSPDKAPNDATTNATTNATTTPSSVLPTAPRP